MPDKILKGLTGIEENARGFCGKTVDNRPSLNGRRRVRFDIACGLPDETKGKFATWRHCIAYDENADKLKDLKTGDLVHVSGWLSTEYMLDPYYKPVIDKNTGYPIKIEHLICFKAEIKEYVKKIQDTQLPLAVGRASEK